MNGDGDEVISKATKILRETSSSSKNAIRKAEEERPEEEQRKADLGIDNAEINLPKSTGPEQTLLFRLAESTGGGSKAAFAVCLFCVIVLIFAFLDQALGGWYLWLQVGRDSLIIYWQKMNIYTCSLPFSPDPSLWIPTVPTSVILAYIIIVERRMELKLRVRGRRIHHYQLGFMAVVASVASMAVCSSCVDVFNGLSSPIQLGWKGTSIAEIILGTCFMLIIGGATLILLDVEDLVSVADNRENRE